MASAAAAKGEVETAEAVIYVRPSIWKRLNDRKGRGMSFDDVISELLDDADEALADDTKVKA